MTKLLDAVKMALSNGVGKPVLRFGDYKFTKAKEKPVMWITFANMFLGGVRIDSGELNLKYGTEQQKAEIKAMLEDMEPYMENHGKETGTCCICGRLLTNEESVRLMIGPICGNRWGFVDKIAKVEKEKIDPNKKFDFSEL